MKGLLLSIVILLNAVSLRAATVAHYKFEGTPDAPLYELTDSSGRGHHGQVLGEERFELTTDVPQFPAITTTALDLRGRLDYAVIPHHSDFAPTSEWTIEFFIKPVLFHQDHGGATNIGGPFYDFINTNEAYTVLYKQNTNEVTKYGSAWAFHYLPAKGWLVFTVSYGADRGETMTFYKDLRDDKWHHVAVAFGTSIENELRVFLDGFKFGSVNQHGGNVPISWGTGPIYVGAWSRQNEFFLLTDRNFDGMIDELRFSDTALEASDFVVDFTPYLFPPIPVEIFSAVEIEFEGQAGQIYRIEQQTSDGAWQTLGYDVGEGAAKSFFHRRDQTSPQAYRVLRDGASSEITFTQHDAVEIRFPTDPGQLYTVQHGESMPVDSVDQVFILGDGAKHSHFQRALSATRFYKVERY